MLEPADEGWHRPRATRCGDSCRIADFSAESPASTTSTFAPADAYRMRATNARSDVGRRQRNADGNAEKARNVEATHCSGCRRFFLRVADANASLVPRYLYRSVRQERSTVLRRRGLLGNPLSRASRIFRVFNSGKRMDFNPSRAHKLSAGSRRSAKQRGSSRASLLSRRDRRRSHNARLIECVRTDFPPLCIHFAGSDMKFV
jgi:hypothetical protein